MAPRAPQSLRGGHGAFLHLFPAAGSGSRPGPRTRGFGNANTSRDVLNPTEEGWSCQDEETCEGDEGRSAGPRPSHDYTVLPSPWPWRDGIILALPFLGEGLTGVVAGECFSASLGFAVSGTSRRPKCENDGGLMRQRGRLGAVVDAGLVPSPADGRCHAGKASSNIREGKRNRIRFSSSCGQGLDRSYIQARTGFVMSNRCHSNADPPPRLLIEEFHIYL